MIYINRVGIYLRLSNEDRDKICKGIDSESIKNQRNMLIQYINKHEDFILVDEYCDEDLSGAGTYRPEFERLIKDCEEHKLDIVLCKSQSRFSRDMEIIEKYIHNKFLEWNIRFIGLSDNADTKMLGNKKSRQINGLVNEWYLEDVSNNIRSAFYSKMRQGEFISPFAPFGYKVSITNNNQLVIDEMAAYIVKDIYKLYLNGLGFTTIAKYLNSKNIPSPSLYKYLMGIKLNIVSKKRREDIKWNANAIKTILTNEVYLGHLIQGKRTTISYKNHKIKKKDRNEWKRVLNTHEAIISEEIFKKVQIAIQERTKFRKANGIIHMFSGKVFCLECKSCMRKKNSTKYQYLVCSNNSYGSYCINKRGIRYDELVKLVLKSINKIISIYYDESLLKEFINKEREKDINTNINFLKKQKMNICININEKNNYLKNLYEDKVNGIITLEQFNSLSDIYKIDIKNLYDKLKIVDQDINNCMEIMNSCNYQEILFKYKEINVLNRIVVQKFIDKIYIGGVNNKSREIYIKWNFL